MNLREAIVAEARKSIGTRYRHQGRTPGVGLDCIGTMGAPAIAYGVQGAFEWSHDEELNAYGKTPDPVRLRDGCRKYLDPIPIADVRPADILIMRHRTEREPRHFAMVSGLAPMFVIHAYAQMRMVKEQRMPLPDWRVVEAYRFRGID